MIATKPQGNSYALLKRLIKTYLPRHKKRLIIAAIAMLVVSACMSLIAYYIQPLFDGGLIRKRIGVLNTVVIALTTLTLVKGIAYFIQGYFMSYIGQRIITDLQKDLYSRLIKQDLTFFQLHPTASLTSRFISDLQRMKNTVIQLFHSGLRDTAVIIGLVGNMLYQDWQLTLVTLVIFPAAIIPMRRFGRLMRKYSRVNQESTGVLAHLLNQSLGHIRQVQSFTMENHETKQTHNSMETVFNTTAKAAKVQAVSSPVIELIGTLAIGAIMLYAGYRIADGAMTPGAFASFLASAVIVIRPVRGLTNLNNVMQEGLAAAERTFAIMDEPIRIKNQIGATDIPVRNGEITFDNVTLTYPDGTKALTDLDLTIPSGKTIALVGASGAGKSTVLNLIPRFFDPSQGRILIDDADIRSATLESVRRNIALVSQDVAIFDDTIAANIAYGNPDASQECIEKAAKDAAAHAFIQALPEGYQTRLGEDGVKLSGGQKQRIAIARALVKNAPILLLDEATSALDTESERQVQQALETLMKNRTTLVIAHRLSTVVKADMIHVMEQGQIIESGKHTTLLAKDGAYANLWKLQSNG